jgi:hypothetical protein
MVIERINYDGGVQARAEKSAETPETLAVTMRYFKQSESDIVAALRVKFNLKSSTVEQCLEEWKKGELVFERSLENVGVQSGRMPNLAY